MVFQFPLELGHATLLALGCVHQFPEPHNLGAFMETLLHRHNWPLVIELNLNLQLFSLLGTQRMGLKVPTL